MAFSMKLLVTLIVGKIFLYSCNIHHQVNVQGIDVILHAVLWITKTVCGGTEDNMPVRSCYWYADYVSSMLLATLVALKIINDLLIFTGVCIVESTDGCSQSQW